MRVKLGDIFEIGSGGTPSKSHPEYYGGDIPWVKTGDLKNEYLYEVEDFITEEGLKNSSAKVYEADTVLIAMYGATIGATSILKINACTNQACAAFKKNEQVIPEYLYYFLRSQKKKFVKDGVGGAQPNISAGYLKKVEMELPSLEEQRAIVDILDKTSDIVIKRNHEIQSLDDLIKARFVELFGIPIDNTKNWPMDKAENLCTLVTDGSHFSPKACDEGYPMLSVKDMRQNGFDYSDCKLVDDETFEILKKQGCVPQVDDVLIAKDGSYFTRAFAISEYKDQAILSSIGMYRPDKDKILPRFLASYLMTNEVIEFVNRGYVTGTALRRVIIKGLKNIPVYMPPLELQKEFVQFAEQTDKSKVVCVFGKLTCIWIKRV
ncbi:MAG: restriction endonuclease subunit S [Acetivibrio ethanolgignens]